MDNKRVLANLHVLMRIRKRDGNVHSASSYQRAMMEIKRIVAVRPRCAAVELTNVAGERIVGRIMTVLATGEDLPEVARLLSSNDPIAVEAYEAYHPIFLRTQ